jgi:hypothetical protein
MIAAGGLLIIDDVEASLAAMTALGRSIVGRSAECVRNAVIAHASRRGWCVVRHETAASDAPV